MLRFFSAYNPYGQAFSLRHPIALREDYPDDLGEDHEGARSYETNRDVKWICRTLQRMEAQDEDFESRIRALEGWRAEKAGEEKGVSTISAGRYREWTAGLAVWLEEGCNEGCKEVLEDVEPEPAEKTALSGCDLRSFATPSGAEGVPGLLSIPGTTAGRVQPLPGVLDRGTFVRVKTEIGRCDICDRGKAVYRSREARTSICEGCYSRLVRERNGREGVR
jgi:hypothetical protein